MRLREKLRRQPRLLVVTAVVAERDAVLAGLGPVASAHPEREPGHTTPMVVLAGGVGAAEAAASTARALAMAQASRREFTLVLSAGIAGAFEGRAALGDTVVADRIIGADLGAHSATGLISLDELGFGSATRAVDAEVRALLTTALPHAVPGDLLTVSAATGTHGGERSLRERFPGAVAEAMEGYGVAVAATQAAVAAGEVRTISNLVGPRDRSGWRVDAALAALTETFAALRNLASAE